MDRREFGKTHEPNDDASAMSPMTFIRTVAALFILVLTVQPSQTSATTC